MSKNHKWALVLIGLAVMVLIFNRGKVSVDLVVTTVNGIKALVFLGFIAFGVLIGVLFK